MTAPPPDPAAAAAWTRWIPRAVAVAVAAPIFIPGAEAYIDNAPHLAELHLLATQILPEDRWFTGWTDAIEGGTAVHQLNAPLVWTPLAAFVALGLPPTQVYASAVVLAHLVFVEGARRLALRLGAEGPGAALAAVLAVGAVPELYGYGGAIGGMWPYRLGLGIWALGAGSLRVEGRAWSIGLWVAAIVLTHSFAGGLVLGWVGVSVVAALLRRAPVIPWLGGCLLAAGLSAPLWIPLLDADLRRFGEHFVMPPLDAAAYAVLPLQPLDLIRGNGWQLDGGVAASVAFGAAWVGVGLLLTRRRPVDTLVLRVVVSALGVVGAIVAVGALETMALGPNPWRYASFVHLLFMVAGGIGLGRVLRGVAPVAAVSFAVVAAASWVAAEVVPRRADNPKLWTEMSAAWRDAPRVGRVYVEDPAFDTTAPDLLANTHVGALAVVEVDQHIMGTWYGVNPIPTSAWLVSEGPLTLAEWPGGLAANVDALYQRFRVFGVGSIVAYSEELVGVLLNDPRYLHDTTHGAFHLFTLVEPPPEVVGVPKAVGAVSDVRWERGHISARITATAERVPVRVRVAWHPWWRATLNGEEIPTQAGPGDGLVSAEVTGSGDLELRWVDPTRWTLWLSLGSLLVLVGLARRRG